MSKTSKELLAEFSDDHVPYCGEAHNEAYSKVMDMVISPKPKQYQIGIDMGLVTAWRLADAPTKISPSS